MITPLEAKKRTREIIEDHINECGCRNLTDVQCVLTALISMAAQAVVATNGKPTAIAVLKATLIHTALHEVPYQMETTADGDVRITVARKH